MKWSMQRAVGDALFLLIASAAAAEVPPCASRKPAAGEISEKQMRDWGITMPRPVACTSDADCAGCTSCRRGGCEPVEWGGNTSCMCDDECVRIGQSSCDLSPFKPLCGGRCTDSPPHRPLLCGRDEDVVRIERFPGQECVTDMAVPAPAGTIMVQVEPDGPGTPEASSPSTVADSAELTPPSPACTATCARLEAIGPVTELPMPEGDAPEESVVTFAAGHWYAAWGGRESNATFVQRFTSEGRIDGQALRIEGTAMPRALIATSQGGGGLLLIGYVRPSYSPAGAMHSVHRLGLDLRTVPSRLLLRGPGMAEFGRGIEINHAGEIVWRRLLDRPGMLAREVAVPPRAVPGKELGSRDWWLGVEREGAIEHVGGRDYFLDANQGSLRVRGLLPGGLAGPPHHVFSIPREEGRQGVLSGRTGSRWFVGAHAVGHAPTVRIQEIDASSLAPVGGMIELRWPGTVYSLVDANGTPALLGSLQPASEPMRTSLAPIDLTARAACRASTILIPSLPRQYQIVRALHFNEEVAGVTVATWDNKAVTRFFFTRLRCVKAAPAAPPG